MERMPCRKAKKRCAIQAFDSLGISLKRFRPAQMKAPLLHLPLEILVHIVEMLSDPDDKFCVEVVCHKMRTAAVEAWKSVDSIQVCYFSVGYFVETARKKRIYYKSLVITHWS